MNLLGSRTYTWMLVDLKNWGGFEKKKHLFESKAPICLLNRVPPHRRPVYILAIGYFTTGPVLAQFIFLLFPCQEHLIYVGISTLAVVAAFSLKMTYCGYLSGRLYKEGRDNRVSSCCCCCKSFWRSRQSYRWLSPLFVFLPSCWKSRMKRRRRS